MRAGSRWPHIRNSAEVHYLPFPFFLAYSASLLKENGFNVTLIDAIAEKMSYAKFFHLMRRLQPDLIVSETSTVTLEHDLGLLRKVKQINKNSSIALCGPDINIRRKDFLPANPVIDYILVGEYEFTLLDLARHLKESRDIKDLMGVICRDKDEIRVNPPRPLCDLDKLPWPLREGLPMENYNDTPGDMPLPSVQILASRGCPYSCKFCLWPQVMYHGNQYRARSVSDVVDEMEYLVRRMNFKSVYFDDDTFNCGKQRMLNFSSEIKKRGLDIPWGIMARADLMDEEILENMRNAGLYAVKYGIESASQELLDNINKNMDIKKTIESVKFTKMLGIKTHLTFTFGLPGESTETIARTIDLALNLDPASVQFSITTPFPGTSFFKDMEEKGYILSRKWSDYDGNNRSVIYTDILDKKDLEYAVKFAYERWRAHCIQKKALSGAVRGNYHFQLFLNSLRSRGILVTAFKVLRYLARNFALFVTGAFSRCSRDIEKRIEKNDFKVGRLTLNFCENGLHLFWDGMRLTRDTGMLSLVSLKNGKAHESSLGLWNVSKAGENKILLTTKYGILPVEESWSIEVLDEKQIKVDIVLNAQEKIEISKFKVGLVLSERYSKWVDSWGEGYFPLINDVSEVELRNPNTQFVGLRGRKKLKGQLPTVLLDMAKNNENLRLCVKNAGRPLGARVIEAKSKNGGFDLVGATPLFSGVIKIVEEDFKKRKFSNKK